MNCEYCGCLLPDEYHPNCKQCGGPRKAGVPWEDEFKDANGIDHMALEEAARYAALTWDPADNMFTRLRSAPTIGDE